MNSLACSDSVQKRSKPGVKRTSDDGRRVKLIKPIIHVSTPFSLLFLSPLQTFHPIIGIVQLPLKHRLQLRPATAAAAAATIQSNLYWLSIEAINHLWVVITTWIREKLNRWCSTLSTLNRINWAKNMAMVMRKIGKRIAIKAQHRWRHRRPSFVIAVPRRRKPLTIYYRYHKVFRHCPCTTSQPSPCCNPTRAGRTSSIIGFSRRRVAVALAYKR